jgi:hypothetical protein
MPLERLDGLAGVVAVRTRLSGAGKLIWAGYGAFRPPADNLQANGKP